MSDSPRRVPPPPPPEKDQSSPLPPQRRRRLDLPHYGTRSDQQRRAVRLPEPPSDWLDDFDGIDAQSAPMPVPEPPESLGDVLRDMTDTYAPPAPLPPFRPRPLRNFEPPKREDSAKKLHVPMICARHDRAFVKVFRETGSVFGARYKLEATLADVGAGGEAAPSLTVPLSSLDWSGITCPHCGAPCGPIRCGSCRRLACDGLVTLLAQGTFFRCAPSCGASGFARAGLETITASEGTGPKPLSSSHALVPVSDPPTLPTQNVPRLPKPR